MHVERKMEEDGGEWMVEESDNAEPCPMFRRQARASSELEHANSD